MVTTQVTREQCIELVSNPGFYLIRDAALAWDRSIADFGKDVLITGAWRSYQTQVEIFDSELYPRTGRYVRGNHAGERGFTTDVRGRTSDGGLYRGSWWTRKAGTAAAAVPGTSNHGDGVATDAKTQREDDDPPYTEAVVFTSFDDPDRLAFLRVANEHGWYDDEGRSVNEFWHLTWYRDRDKHLGQVAPTEKEFLMALSDEQQDLMFKALTTPIKDGDRNLDLPNALRVITELERRQEQDNKRRNTAERARDEAARLRDVEQQKQIAGLTALARTMAENQGIPVEQMMAEFRAAISNIKVVVSTEL